MNPEQNVKRTSKQINRSEEISNYEYWNGNCEWISSEVGERVGELS
jgi:hypothetical protein